MAKLIELEAYPVWPVLKTLLQDKTTGQNIIFATNAYMEIGEGLEETDQITVKKLSGFSQKILIRPRVEKAMDEQQARTRKKAEVFTPSWIVNKMNNHCDEEWFGRSNVFNTENNQSWTVRQDPIVFEGNRTWHKYVDSKRLEITCGEAPYVVSRYDVSTGELIPLKDRIGILDRKLRVVNENSFCDREWLQWAERAFQSVYGYEYQGDNLLIARINLLLTFTDYFAARFNKKPSTRLLQKFANIISWNFWQMDGRTGTTPFALQNEEIDGRQPLFGFMAELKSAAKVALTIRSQREQLTMFDFMQEKEDMQKANKPDVPKAPVCLIRDWRSNCTFKYTAIRGENNK